MAYDFSVDDAVFHDVGFFGDTASFQALSGGDPVTTTAIVDHEGGDVPQGFELELQDDLVSLSLLFAEVGTPVRGDTVTIGSTLYTVDGIISNDHRDVVVAALEIAGTEPIDPPPEVPAATGYLFNEFQNSQYLGTL